MKVMVCLRLTSLVLLVVFFSLLAQGQGIQASNEEMVKRMGIFGGRKLGAQKEIMVEGSDQGTMNKGANPSVEKSCDHGVKGKLNIKCELSDDRGLPSSVKLVVGLIPLNSDYHAPKTHPPKNN
ncbi:hypothetical protein J5N97_026478 [Dioscorea zingiberensis]|uniref:Uncharacterized protein n=1 Tax=Dioscorea zingiberensis TaxID=325984 RepID=A0A9D5H6T8_9LILI|nr:hypothetical protein J5N97_026478 [Dioscorea zingiberensis]